MKQVELLTNAQFNRIITFGSHKVIDIATMREYRLSFGGARNDHYDVTPTTEADATIMEQIINRVDLNLWRPARPVIIDIQDRLIAAGLTNFMHHIRIGGGNPGPKYPSINENGPPWRRGGHCCLYLSNSVGGAGNAPNAACSAEANRRAMQLHNGGHGGQARAAAFEAYFLGDKVVKILNAKTETEEEEMRFNRLSEMPGWAQETIKKLADPNGAAFIRGSGARDENDFPADMDLSMDMIRMLIINDRAGLYG